MNTDKQIKTQATKQEHTRVFDNYNFPPRDIIVECSDGRWIKRAWTGLNRFGWEKWQRCGR